MCFFVGVLIMVDFPKAMSKVLEKHHGYLRKVAERSANFWISTISQTLWLLTCLLRFGPTLVDFQDGRCHFPEAVCLCDLGHPGHRSEEDRGATHTDRFAYKLCICLQPCFFPSIMWPSFEHTFMCIFKYIYQHMYSHIYIYIYIYICIMNIDVCK